MAKKTKSTDVNMTEVYFEWWLTELKKHGLVIDFVREPETFVLREPKQIFYNQDFPKKESVYRSFNLENGITYTPDYKVVFSSKLFGYMTALIDFTNDQLYNPNNSKESMLYQKTLFYASNLIPMEQEGYVFYFDVKPPSSVLQFSAKTTSSREFPYNKRLMLENHNIIINKVVPIGNSTCLFEKTFMPLRYRYNDSGAKLRTKKNADKIAVPVKGKSFDDYITEKGIVIIPNPT